MNYTENAQTYAEYSWQLTAIILRRPRLEHALCLQSFTWSVRRAPAAPHTDFLVADLRAGANPELGSGAPGPAPTALSPQHRAPLDGFPPPPLRLPPTPPPRGAGGGGGRPSPSPFKSLPGEARQGDPGGGGSSTLSFRSGARSRAPRAAPPAGGARHSGLPDALAAAAGLPAPAMRPG